MRSTARFLEVEKGKALVENSNSVRLESVVNIQGVLINLIQYNIRKRKIKINYKNKMVKTITSVDIWRMSDLNIEVQEYEQPPQANKITLSLLTNSGL